MRASLTILGVAIGVMVVIAMASAITGINRGVQAQIETIGPKTFFVQQYFQGGLNISDGSDEIEPVAALPRAHGAGSGDAPPAAVDPERDLAGEHRGSRQRGDTRLSSVEVIGFSPAWILSVGGVLAEGRNFTELEEAATRTRRSSTTRWSRAVSGARSDRAADQDLRRTVHGRSALDAEAAGHVRQQRFAAGW